MPNSVSVWFVTAGNFLTLMEAFGDKQQISQIVLKMYFAVTLLIDLVLIKMNR